jgi:hypothetical protein
MTTISVQVQQDHLEHLAATGNPIGALAELIWNSLDADATLVEVDLHRNDLGGISWVSVRDNGCGLRHDEALEAFRRLGGSWKKSRSRTVGGRLLHGKLGRGRFKAFALGRRVVWKTVYEEKGRAVTFSITGNRNNIRDFEVSDPAAITTGTPGTLVEISELPERLPSLDSARAPQLLAEEFALYLRQYPDVSIVFDHHRVDPASIEKNKADYSIDQVDIGGGRFVDAHLTIIEWLTLTERALYLCNEDGFTLSRISPGIQAPGYTFTAYLRSSYIRELDDENSLILEDMHPGLRELLKAAKGAMRDHFKRRAAEEAAGLVESWKAQNIYPFSGDAVSPVERTERQVFDVVALSVNSYLPDFESSDVRNKKLAFRLLREAIETSPSSVQSILQDVLDLPEEKIEELARLLRKTSLAAIINSSRLVANRLDFLRGLEILVFDEDTKNTLLERQQLHRIVAEHTWLFSESFNLTVDDQSLTEVLKRHIDMSGLDLMDDSEVRRSDGSTGIIDLMFARSVPQPKPELREYLIVELKRPTVPIDDKALLQVDSYANAIIDDERFREAPADWIFWAVSNRMTDSVRRKVNQKDRPEGLYYEGNDGHVKIWVKTWGQIIDDCRSRLRLFERQLEYKADRASAVDYLRRTHNKYLPRAIAGSASSLLEQDEI